MGTDTPAASTAGDGTDEAGTGADPTTDGPAPTTSAATATEGTTAGGGGLNLAEANVVGVEVSMGDGGARFDVTLYHDDDGEDGYANWWQVETPAGERLGRRDLAHPHGTTRFTRSTTVQVADDVDCVVVRGHDQTHGYGGQAMVVTMGTGATRAVQQGTDPQDFARSECP